jgi:ATP-dependent Lon protease
MLIESPWMNPVAMFDELDKACGNQNALVVPGLLTLLERETSRSFRDEAVKLPIDASQVCWFATANDLRQMSGPLRSRFVEVRIDRPEGEAAITVAMSIYASIRRKAGWGHKFPEELDRSIACRLAGCVPREMSRRLGLAFGEAARQGRCYLLPDDLPQPVPQRRRVGFI